MDEKGFPRHLICLIENLYFDQEAAVRVDGETTDWFSIGWDKDASDRHIFLMYMLRESCEISETWQPRRSRKRHVW